MKSFSFAGRLFMCLLYAAKWNTCTGRHGYSEGKVCKCDLAYLVKSLAEESDRIISLCILLFHQIKSQKFSIYAFGSILACVKNSSAGSGGIICGMRMWNTSAGDRESGLSRDRCWLDMARSRRTWNRKQRMASTCYPMLLWRRLNQGQGQEPG